MPAQGLPCPTESQRSRFAPLFFRCTVVMILPPAKTTACRLSGRTKAAPARSACYCPLAVTLSGTTSAQPAWAPSWRLFQAADIFVPALWHLFMPCLGFADLVQLVKLGSPQCMCVVSASASGAWVCATLVLLPCIIQQHGFRVLVDTVIAPLAGSKYVGCSRHVI